MTPYNELTDDALTTLLKEEDHAAFTEIYKRYWEKLFVVANNRLNDENDAEEVVQDVFFSIWKRRKTLELQYTLNTYLSVAVKYQVINRQSSLYKKSIHKELSEEDEGTADATHLWFAERELKEQLTLAINKLPEKCRIVFLRSREDGQTNAQIANDLNISEKTVEAHITRALNILKSLLHVSTPLLLHLLKK
ncbi:RNA polymerase sigma-70 factor [Pedobacter sp. L105]|uniref:RNA polymerase sigma-70 factor n=1 Tax=Pedobacter sp. L105 TaxID=1641871 RepID=UPI00131E0AC3|nr:RNA polymerase sigma-70 factor [Pedobacter sp. L105]